MAAEMDTFLAFEATMTYGCTLMRARRMNEEEKKHIKPEFHELMMVATGEEYIDLHHIKPQDYPKRDPDGSFRGCSNMAWTISQEEWDHFLELEHTREAEKKKAEREKRLSYLKKELARMEEQGKLYTKEEALQKARWYNNAFNEGGYGFVPHYYTQDEYDRTVAEIKQLEEQ